ncbi:diguanylate cyclase [bacterium]|nr:MAG: diguanylate cyclase [bacterium]
MIRLRVLLPVTITLAVLSVFPITSGSMVYRKMIYHEAEEAAINRANLYRFYAEKSTAGITAFLKVIKDDCELREAWLSRDRQRLLERGREIQEVVRVPLRLTHFYFIEPDGVCYLRVHNPSLYGDKIERYSFLDAQKTGETSSGSEPGPLGTLTLRVVLPWVIDGNTVGYIEGGEDLDQIVKPDPAHHKGITLVLSKKTSVTKESYEAGSKLFSRTYPYDYFANRVVMAASVNDLPGELPKLYSPPEEYSEQDFELRIGDKKYLTVVSVIKDKREEPLGEIMVLTDISEEWAALRRYFYTMLGIFAFGGTALTLIFSAYLRRIDKKLDVSRKSLQELATRDTLTGLYNRSRMTSFMKYQLAMQTRYKTPISIVMMDLDFFKKINDLHGHRAGDAVLKEAAKRLLECARGTDLVVRYGGEEFLVVLPQTGIEGARNSAERLREKMEEKEFPTDVEGKTVKVTASFGVSEKTSDDDFTIEQFIEYADKALYRAKTSGRNKVCTMEKMGSEW